MKKKKKIAGWHRESMFNLRSVGIDAKGIQRHKRKRK